MIFYIITLCLFLSYQRTVSVNNETFNYTVYKSSMENVDLFEGDIRLDTSLGESRAAVLTPNKLWDDGIIFYKFSPFLNYYRIKFLKSIFKYMEIVTCLRFVRRRRENNYIYIQEGKGCNSYVGKEGGRQILNLGSGCWNIGIILHELCHAIGLYHEHSRPDRDKYIKILWDNITDEFKTEFQVYDKNFLRICDDYSYDSIMHYGPKSFAKDGKISLMPILPNVTIKEVYEWQILSESDIECINKLYKCK
ncbi:astacin-like metalloprotease toxin 5 isoform X6 [Centruroides sculpturatus]|uniref:astacin-like metalloprotease toxin 5 isoform X6 n=1 Tax=Centruroides sculpturatus TaxID=218467 RepID=UPI000C6C9B84|nr:astacin-like metalloprotease toxin 5 isoform X6 [Centruroides sculpturatus]